MNQNQPDIRFFDKEYNFGKFFAVYDYMGVYPPLKACENYLAFCDDCRKNKLKLPPRVIESETRAYLAIKEGKYVTNKYSWEK